MKTLIKSALNAALAVEAVGIDEVPGKFATSVAHLRRGLKKVQKSYEAKRGGCSKGYVNDMRRHVRKLNEKLDHFEAAREEREEAQAAVFERNYRKELRSLNQLAY